MNLKLVNEHRKLLRLRVQGKASVKQLARCWELERAMEADRESKAAEARERSANIRNRLKSSGLY